MKPQRVLVTGASGFVGQKLTEYLSALGHEVVCFSLENGEDVRKFEHLERFVERDIETVFHLAANTFVPESWRNPGTFYKTNCLGTLNVLEFCRKAGARMIFISAYVYGPPRYLPIDEKHPVQPNNPYAHSKVLGEELCQYYTKFYGIHQTILRPSNLYGPGQANHFLIPTLIKQIKEEKKIIIKDGRPKRDFIHIEDFLNACGIVLQLQEPDQIYHLSAGQSISVKRLIELIFKIAGIPPDWQDLREVRPNEIMDTAMTSQLTERGIWKPRIALDAGIKDLLEDAPAE